MSLPIDNGRLLTCIRIAIFTKMGAGVILAYVFALDAAAELALALITVVTVRGVGAVWEDDGIG